MCFTIFKFSDFSGVSYTPTIWLSFPTLFVFFDSTVFLDSLKQDGRVATSGILRSNGCSCLSWRKLDAESGTNLRHGRRRRVWDRMSNNPHPLESGTGYYSQPPLWSPCRAYGYPAHPLNYWAFCIYKKLNPRSTIPSFSFGVKLFLLSICFDLSISWDIANFFVMLFSEELL